MFLCLLAGLYFVEKIGGPQSRTYTETYKVEHVMPPSGGAQGKVRPGRHHTGSEVLRIAREANNVECLIVPIAVSTQP
jgi:hypothetical protein